MGREGGRWRGCKESVTQSIESVRIEEKFRQVFDEAERLTPIFPQEERKGTHA
jgi:hypothetical protein